jgi:flavin reductase (DIM6/NTAB) family NADH-FMN oxidoreductase RutF
MTSDTGRPELGAPDLEASAYTLAGLRTFPVAVTTVSEGRTNGCIVLSAHSGSVVDEAPRVMIGLTKYNLTHDLVLESGVFAAHLLAAGSDESVGTSLEILMGLGGRSGRDADKLAPFETRVGVGGSPILLDALSYVEGRVVNTMDAEENTVFLADVVAAGRLRDGKRLDIGEAWRRLPAEWIEGYEHAHTAQVADARRRRGLPAPDAASPMTEDTMNKETSS